MDVAKTGAIERIARVLAGQRLSANADGVFRQAAPDVDDEWEAHVDDAIAVLKTLRAPDEEMAEVGDVAIWERMIAAALGTPFDIPERGTVDLPPSCTRQRSACRMAQSRNPIDPRELKWLPAFLLASWRLDHVPS